MAKTHSLYAHKYGFGALLVRFEKSSIHCLMNYRLFIHD